MCEPVTALAIVSAGTALASGGIGAYGAYQQGKGAEAQAEYEAMVARQNAHQQEVMARYAVKRGEYEEQRQRQVQTQLMGEQRAALAGSGITVDTDSAGQLMGDMAALGDLDAQVIRENAAMRAYGHRAEAINERNRAALALNAGKNARKSSYLEMAAIGLNTASTAIGQAYAAGPSPNSKKRSKRRGFGLNDSDAGKYFYEGGWY